MADPTDNIMLMYSRIKFAYVPSVSYVVMCNEESSTEVFSPKGKIPAKWSI